MATQRIVLQCCNKKRCPEIYIHDDGSAVIVDKDYGRDEEINLSPEQVVLLRETLNSMKL